ncbi:MAG: prepilin-type N-terminal cleavage/methylation domain-containing protein [Candidatus Auribacterota bacterium]|nr:prepilin-type N-terminal cleavage/methylation domain-containing protein [Candidatus Auribacterota bacterium]
MRKKKGFTLIELLVVLSIIAVIVGFLFPAIKKVKEQARKARASAMIEAIGMALHAYRADWGIFGPSESELNADGTLYKMLTTTKYNGPYMELRNQDLNINGSNKRIADPWGGIYSVYTDIDGGSNNVPPNNKHSFDISCTLPDGTTLNNWD